MQHLHISWTYKNRV